MITLQHKRAAIFAVASTYAEFCDMADVTWPTLNKWIHGKGGMSDHTRERIIQALDKNGVVMRSEGLIFLEDFGHDVH